VVKSITKTDGYKILVNKIRKELRGLETLIKRKTVDAYWQVGKYICDDLLAKRDRAGYGEHLYQRLSGDLSVSDKTLKRTAQFYRAYPIRTQMSQLTWTHFLLLLTVQDQAKRRLLEQQALSQNWRVPELRRRINVLKGKRELPKETQGVLKPELPKKGTQDVLKPELTEGGDLDFTRGKLNCYRLVEAEAAGLLIDLGFQMRREFPEGSQLGLVAADCIEVSKEGSTYTTKKASISLDELFTYRATLESVIDADTFWVLIDCDFGMFIRQKIRLRGIDCPEITTEAGRRAKKFVQDKLSSLQFIIVKTHRDKTEKYGRYLADVFFQQDESNPAKVSQRGRFLNQELLDSGLARLAS